MRRSIRSRAIVLDIWPLCAAVVLCFPLLTRAGHPLARDLVFVPHQPWTAASVGLGSSAPRSIPLDTIVSALTAGLLDGGVVARLAIPLILACAGWGAHRLVRDLGMLARVAAGGFAVWNPYVVERLALGQWALLAGYAALPWLVVAASRYRRSGERGDLGAVTGWLALASLTPTGGLLGAGVALATGAARRAATVPLVLVALLLQLPWLVPSFLGSAALTSDPAGVGAFAADSEGPGGVATALLGLGGIWDSRSVPDSRAAWWSVASAVVAAVVLVAGWRGLVRIWGRGTTVRLAGLAGAGFVLALLPHLPGGHDLLVRVVEVVPGGGLVRDSQKFLAPYVVLIVAALAATVDALARRAAAGGVELLLGVGLLAVPLPVLLLPDATSGVWPTVDPVTYPDGLDAVASEVDGQDGTLAALPWRSYRLYSWGNGLISSDPAVRWFDTDVLVSDDLQVGTTLVGGENRRAADLGRALAREPVAEALSANDVRWALVYVDDPGTPDLDLTGLTPVYADDDVALYSVPGVTGGEPGPGPARWVAVAVADLLAAGTVLAGIFVAVRRRPKSPDTDDPLLP